MAEEGGRVFDDTKSNLVIGRGYCCLEVRRIRNFPDTVCVATRTRMHTTKKKKNIKYSELKITSHLLLVQSPVTA